jgi:hypothetical protein
VNSGLYVDGQRCWIGVRAEPYDLNVSNRCEFIESSPGVATIRASSPDIDGRAQITGKSMTGELRIGASVGQFTLKMEKTKRPRASRADNGSSVGTLVAEALVRFGQANLNNPWYGTGDQSKLMIFGGAGHRVYLGCLNCPSTDTDSVLNSYGTHGNTYSSQSILNHLGDFGSGYSTYSACNEYASDPPVVVDGTGRFYGRLTLNQYHPQAPHSPQVLGWLVAACGS